MKRLAAAALVVSFFASANAFADEQPAAPATPAADKAPEQYVEPAREGKGFVAEFGTAFMVPVGKPVDVPGVQMSDFVGPGQRGELRLGYYFTPHVGLMIGANGSFNAGGCSKDDGCGAYTFQAPVVAQYAFVNRKKGLYVEAGVAVLNYYGSYAPDATASFSSVLSEGRLAIGYRLPFDFSQSHSSPTRTSLNVSLFAEGGQFTHASVHTPDGSVDGDVTKTALHATFGFGFSYAFTP